MNRGFKNIGKSWRRLLCEIELARNYHQPYLLYAAQIHRNPILEYLLPSLLYIKMVSILDWAFVSYSEDHGLAVSKKKYENSLKGRIDFYDDQGLISNAAALHAVRKNRNAIAHEVRRQASWDDLGNDLAEIEMALQGLSLVDERPNLEFYAEMSAAKESEKPDVLFAQDFSYGLKEDGQPLASVTWIEEFKSVVD